MYGRWDWNIRVNDMEKTTQEYEKAINYIIEMIKRGELSLGSRLPPERKIADELGIGRNSIREAISILHGMGLIERVQGSGNYVSKNVGQSIRRTITVMMALGTVTKQEIFEFRRVMEKAVCGNLITKSFSNIQKEELEHLLKEMQTSEGKKLAQVDKQFHDRLILETENRLWIVLMEAITDTYQEWIDYVIECADGNMRETLRICHDEIYQSLIKKEEQAMIAAIDRHYDLIEQLL